MPKTSTYRDSLNLPKTSFGMKANLVQREPQFQKQWAQGNLYDQIRSARQGASRYLLHDGPPYANGDIHMGHLINKVLKDIVVKYKTMTGHDSPYLPGWDCHGLPIEHKVMQELGDEAASMDRMQIRHRCRKYAQKYVKTQSKQFQRLGVFGDFESPYLTMSRDYEAGIIEVFAGLTRQGLVYKQLKPVHWSIANQTALAEAELEYEQHDSPSVYVNFNCVDGTSLPGVDDRLTREFNLMIWTTTPWTLPANLAVAVHPDYRYALVQYQKGGRPLRSLIATDLVESVMNAGGIGEYKLVNDSISGASLVGIEYTLPIRTGSGKVVAADYVTLEDGTGLVHTAPGHGHDDYLTGLRHGLEIYCPVRNDGSFDDTVPDWLNGLNVWEANPEIIANLEKYGALFHTAQIKHSYPHDWRSKTPTIFRATEQWFVAVDKTLAEGPAKGKTLRQLALEQIDRVHWVPAWGQSRIVGMIENRPDWCISRQRSWGVPVPVFYQPNGEALLTEESVMRVAKHFQQHGADSWFTHSPSQILGDDFNANGVDSEQLSKETDILDVWFESGSSWKSVCGAQNWSVPVELYLEGSDQHRGWFQSSLLCALGTISEPPYKTVLTHGFVVDAQGYKMSKSSGNVVSVQDEVQKYGADVLRLWVASVNYQDDVRTSDSLIGQLQDAYRKVRNTIRFLLGNLQDFDPGKHRVKPIDYTSIDRWADLQVQHLLADCRTAYEQFQLHRAFSEIHSFCTVTMSSIYLDVLKDRMYCDPIDSPSRRSGQTVMYDAATALITLLAPVLVHTAEEAYASIDPKPQNVGSVHLAEIPHPADDRFDAEFEYQWQRLISIRDDVLAQLEGLRQEEIIGNSLEARVTLTSDDSVLLDLLNSYREVLPEPLLVSDVQVIESGTADDSYATGSAEPKLKLLAVQTEAGKCARCWRYVADPNEQLCPRCDAVVG